MDATQHYPTLLNHEDFGRLSALCGKLSSVLANVNGELDRHKKALRAVPPDHPLIAPKNAEGKKHDAPCPLVASLIG